MEQLVLGLFQEQLSKIIVGFRKEQVNANVLNGKGEITDVSINCSVVNNAIARIFPFIEFDSVHVSRLGFHVTSWSNLRKAPILIDIGCVKVFIKEPLRCVPEHQRKRIRMITEKELVQLLLEGLYKPLRSNTSYGFADRIADNLTIEIEKVQINLQTCGKFKTLRIGPWTPPQLQLECSHLKVVSVDQHGNEGDPEQNWAHNRHERQNFLLYKKITMETSIKVISNGSDQVSATLVESMPVAIQSAVKRRLRDGAFLALQTDITIPTIEVAIRAEWIPLLAHLMTGLHYCFAKDRSFEDPLRHKSDNASKPADAPESKIVKRSSSREGLEEEEELEDSDGDDEEGDTAHDNLSLSDQSSGDENDTVDEPTIKQGSSHGPKAPTAPYRNRPIVLLPNGLVLYENLSITCSIHHISVRGTYADKQPGFVLLTAKGSITELIWPKANNEFGLYAQSSLSFLSVQERSGQQIRHIIIGGISHNDHPSLDKPKTKPREIGVDENFPLFERRSIRDDPLELRHSFPSQAIGLKTTIDFPDANGGEKLMVLHEIGLDEFDLVFDAGAWSRVLHFCLHEGGGGFDPRWHSGDWTEELTTDMLSNPGDLVLEDHIQTTKLIFLDENSLISSDDLNITARVSNIEIRVPAAVQDNIRACDILIELKESTLVVSSALPRTFLSGKIGNSINGDASTDKGSIDFPNDPSDIAYALERTEDPSLKLQGVETLRNVSTFRLQLTVRGFQTKIVPVLPFCNGPEPQQLVAPTDYTMIICFEGEPPEPGSNFVKVTLFISIQLHKILLNVDFDLLTGATSTLLYHAEIVKDSVARAAKLLKPPPFAQENDGKVQKNLHGRRVLVRRHFDQSREAGGLGIVFCLQQAEFGITVWRQNVPLTSPLRDGSHYVDPNSGDGHITILRLFDINFKQIELGVEFDFHAGTSRRIVVKACVEQGTVRVCNVASEFTRVAEGPISGLSSGDGAGTSANSTDADSRNTSMVELLSFGADVLPSDLVSSYPGPVQHFALRLEEQVKESRSWSLAADLTSPAMISLHADAFNDFVLLSIEALLMPALSRKKMENSSRGIFPSHTVGAYFAEAFGDIRAPSASVPQDDEVILDDANAETDAFVERALRVVFKRFLPTELRLVLLRLELSNVLVCIPAQCQDLENKRRLGLLLNKSDVVVRFVPVAEGVPRDMETVLACKGIAWSDLITAQGRGYFQSVSSTQSLITTSVNDLATEIETLVHPFDVGMAYEAANFSLSMNNKLMINDIRRIEDFVAEVESLAGRCRKYHSDLLSLCGSISKPLVDWNELEVSTIVSEIQGATPNLDGESSQNTRKLLRKVNIELGHFEKDLRDILRKKDDQIEALKRQLFIKEKERFAALALVSSRISGWLRVGGVHQTGQRVARKSTMWPVWAVLRKNLLLLFSGPGEAKPVDVIFLPRAKLRELAGGRSRTDVKRGFALIESTGTTRYFMASSAKEYTLWIREISNVLELCGLSLSTAQYQSEGGIDGGFDGADVGGVILDAKSDDPRAENIANGDNNLGGPGGRRPRTALGNRLAATKTKLGSAFQSARLRGKDDSDASGPFREEEDSGEGDYRSFPSFDETLAASESVGDTESLRYADGIGEETNPATPNRRIQFGRRRQGSGPGFGSMIGSALQNARQKGADTPDRQQQRSLAGLRDKFKRNRQTDDSSPGKPLEQKQSAGTPSANDHTHIDGNFQWTCKACTYLNNSENLPVVESTCAICDSERPPEEISSLHHEIDQALSNPSQKTPTVSSQSTDQAGQDVVGGESLDTSVIVDSEPSSVPEVSRTGMFSGLGAVVSSKRLEAQNRNRTGGRFNFMKRAQSSGDEDTLFDGGAVTLKNVHASTRVPTYEGDSGTIPMKIFKNRWIVAVEHTGTGIRHDSEAKAKIEKPFFVRAYKANQAAPDKGIEQHFSIGDLFNLHAQISSGIDSVLPQLISDRSDQSMDRILPQVETVVVVGRILDGLLDLEDDEMVEKTQPYIAELFESFLNSVLACPLPIDALASISEILGIDSSTIDVGSQKSRNGSTQGEVQPNDSHDTELTTERSESMLSILRACETELLRAENRRHPAAVSRPVPTQDTVPSTYEKPNNVLSINETIVPASVTERFQDAMHKALMNVMAERDDAHAQLISANVLHIHQLELEKRKNERLKMEMQVAEEAVKFRQPNQVVNFLAKFDDTKHKQLESKLKSFEQALKKNSDEEMASLCQQLASEISEKTAHALEIARLKETMAIEKANRDAENEGLKEELRRVKQLLSEERENRENASRETAHLAAPMTDEDEGFKNPE